MKNGKTAIPEFNSETQDTLRKAKVDQLRQGYQRRIREWHCNRLERRRGKESCPQKEIQ